MKPGTIIGGLLMAALGAAAWWGGTELTEPAVTPEDMELAARAFAVGKKLGQAEGQPECVRLAISHSDDPVAGSRRAIGEEVEMAWVSDIVVCPGEGGSVGGPEYGGTLFIDLGEAD